LTKAGRRVFHACWLAFLCFLEVYFGYSPVGRSRIVAYGLDGPGMGVQLDRHEEHVDSYWSF
jgi:hypothetical protein